MSDPTPGADQGTAPTDETNAAAAPASSETSGTPAASATPAAPDAPATPVTPAAPAAPATPAPASNRPVGTPAPEYGEIAPEGWSWQPEGSTSASPAAPASPSAQTPAAGGSSAGSGSSQGGSYSGGSGSGGSNSGQLPGVPHNLGVGADQRSSAPASQPPQGSRDVVSEQSYRATQPPVGAGNTAGGTPERPARLADRIITILLLAIGAYGALNSALSLYNLPATLNLLASMLEIDGFVVPAAVGTLGTVGALIILAIFALNLIYSIQRMRSRKLAFWVPLAAGAIAFIVLFALTMIAMSQTPELMQQLSDPDATSKLLNSLMTQS